MSSDHFCVLWKFISSHLPQQQTRVLIQNSCVSISADTMPRLSVALNSRRVRAGQRPGKVESQWNRKKNKHCWISFCQMVQLGTNDPLKSVFALPSITCWKEHRLARTCHCLYSTETWIKSVSLLICMPSQQCSHCKYLSKKKKKTPVFCHEERK